jgi:hypothetical protein
VYNKLIHEIGMSSTVVAIPSIADLEVKSWDQVKARVWETVQAWEVASTAMEAAIQACKAGVAKSQDGITSELEKSWCAASTEERKALQAAQAQGWDETTTQIWYTARAKLWKESEVREMFRTEFSALLWTAAHVIDAACTATIQAAKTWKKAHDETIAIGNTKQNPGTQKK